MRIGVHGKEFDRKAASYMEAVFDFLQKNKIETLVSSRFVKHLKHVNFRRFKFKTYEPGESLRHLKFFLSFGGDGTLLESVTHVGKAGVPILGVNTGRLGFLATTPRDEVLQALQQMLDGAFTLDRRTMLRLQSNQDLFAGFNFGLNDFTLVKKDTSSMITVHTYIDGEFLNSYWADGLIVSTPTGSTGYSLSCGGPLVFPRSGNFILTPVSPHNLTVRPIVVSDSAEISFRVEGRSKKFLVSLDSRIETVDESVKLKLTKADFYANLVMLEGNHYFKTLRQKLNWGLDFRN